MGRPHSFIIVLFWLILTPTCGIPSGIPHVKYFETLSSEDLTVRHKRSDDDTEAIKFVHFGAFNKSFQLVLKPGAYVLANDFQAVIVHKDGSSSIFHVDHTNTYTGVLDGNPDGEVIAHKEGSLWSIKILVDGDIYAVEPAWRFAEDYGSLEDTMVVYRVSDLDVKLSQAPYSRACDDEDDVEECKQNEKENDDICAEGVDDIKSEEREKRDESKTKPRTTCLICAIGDYDFFKGWCKGSYINCASTIIDFIQFADTIYRRQKFVKKNGDIVSGVRLQLGMIQIYTSYNDADPLHMEKAHFNDEGIAWTPQAKLKALGMASKISLINFCLTHLFTSYAFSGGVMGLAWVSQSSNTGICGRRGSNLVAYNTGWTSTFTHMGYSLSSLHVNLIFTHGHNFGSTHDPATHECAKSAQEGGNFLMWAMSVDGHHPNNFQFSPCSLKMIGRQLDYKMKRCFRVHAKIKAFCGNGILEAHEECDTGQFQPQRPNQCCSRKCRLKGNAICSEMNKHCCVNCQMASNNTVCVAESSGTCKQSSACTGVSFECPLPLDLKDGTPCLNKGKCLKGTCLDFCSVEGRVVGKQLKSCLCSSNEDYACFPCCFDNGTDVKGPCEPYSLERLQNGRQCFKGLCFEGKCEVVVKNTLVRLYQFVISMQTSKFILFMKSNIVMTVVVLTALLWIPASWLISIQDEREREAFENPVGLWNVYNERQVSSEHSLVRSPKSSSSSSPPPSHSLTRSPSQTLSLPQSPSHAQGEKHDSFRSAHSQNRGTIVFILPSDSDSGDLDKLGKEQEAKDTDSSGHDEVREEEKTDTQGKGAEEEKTDRREETNQHEQIHDEERTDKREKIDDRGRTMSVYHESIDAEEKTGSLERTDDEDESEDPKKT
ncbi:ADAM 17-like protease isoform X2 [Aplysia californica]|uniref:ADAM 17-like protease isoform X2 n=1 Tax=Aplysia californica TaxID=6500 RepID=A0ABM1VUG7_APLCA|nr:ADAM 17-like protease isoform X2 [Aplysia californica]